VKTSTITVLISPTKSIVPLELNPFEQHIMDEKADIKRFNNIFVTHRDTFGSPILTHIIKKQQKTW